MVEFNSYTTRLELLDANNRSQPNIGLKTASTSPVPVYINDIYFVLDSETPIDVNTDSNGSITIVQQSDSVLAVSYNITIASAEARRS
jgi:hypothetical protein